MVGRIDAPSAAIPSRVRAAPPPSSLRDPPRFHYFFDLPPELRLQILTHLCHSPCGYAVGIPPRTYAEEGLQLLDPLAEELPAVEVPLNLFLTCAQLCREASALFYEANTFYITLTPKRKHCAYLLEGPTALFSRNSAAVAARRRMQSVTLCITRLRGDVFEKEVAPALEDMILQGALRSFEIRFYPPRSPFANDPQHNLLQSIGVNRQLLRLLVDPYLHRRAVKVYLAHANTWCPFHGEMVSGSYQGLGVGWQMHPVSSPDQATPDGRTVAGTVLVDQGYRLGYFRGPWIDLDVDRLIRPYGGCERAWDILAVGGRVT